MTTTPLSTTPLSTTPLSTSPLSTSTPKKPSYKYKLSYADHIRKFKAERADANKRLSDLRVIDCFPNHIFDIDLPYSKTPIDKKYWYKKCFRREHEYILDVFNSDVTQNAQFDCYSELQGKDGWLSPEYDNQAITVDFLTGYYLAKALIRVRNETVAWFQYGCSNTQLYNGVNAHLDTNVGRFTRYGADRALTRKLLQTRNTFDDKNARQSRLSALDDNLVERKVAINLDNVFNGVTRTGDLTNVNVLKSIRNQLNEIAQLGFFISDVYPTSMCMLYNSMLIPLMDVTAKGFSVIRLPDPHTWGGDMDITKTNKHKLMPSTSFANFLILICSHYNVTKIFKTPWGKTPKYYLIVSDRYSFVMSRYTTLIRYINDACENSTPILSKKFDFTSRLTILNKLQEDLLNFYEHKSNEQANEYWLEHVAL